MTASLLTVIVGGMALSCGPSRREHAETLASLEALREEVMNKDARISYLESEMRKMAAQLAESPEVIETVKVEKVKDTIRFTILNEVLFAKGSFDLQSEGLAALEHLLELIGKQYPERDLVIEGHTDDQPYRDPEKFSNWELSANRALAVLRYFQDRGVAPERLSVAAFGQYRPVEDNSTEEGRRRNRRAVVVVQPAGESVERVQHAAEAEDPASPPSLATPTPSGGQP